MRNTRIYWIALIILSSRLSDEGEEEGALMQAPATKYKNLTTPQLKAALRQHGIVLDSDNLPSRKELEELCRQHGITVSNDLQATRARVAAELRRASCGEDTDELRAAIQRALQTRGSCAASDISSAQEQLAKLEAAVGTTEAATERQLRKERLEHALKSASLEELDQALQASRLDETLVEERAAAEQERTRLQEVRPSLY